MYNVVEFDEGGPVSMHERYVNLSTAELVEHALRRGEGTLTDDGALAVDTGKYTGRSPKDKFIVRDEHTESEIHWGSVNQPITPETFEYVYNRVQAYLQNRSVYVFQGYAGADARYRLPIQVTTEYAWHNLFARTMFIRPTPDQLLTHKTQFHVISAPGFKADPSVDGTASEAFIFVHFSKGIILIGGTEYAGEIKKSIFSVLNYMLPKQNVVPMHCSANMGREGDTALFFGLSGTGKTTLSTDPHRQLIGDDEHGWSDHGIFNFEGGCYAKCIQLSQEKEPDIWQAIRFGSVLENVVMHNGTRVPDYDDGSKTENTRVAYPIHHIQNAVLPSVGHHPETIVFLTADAFGVLPPVARLTTEQAMYHFLSGYTSKLAGTERGVTEPEATFSTCFGAPFLPLPPNVYAEALGKRIIQHNTQVFLVNTGWTGGPYGEGERMNLNYTRAMVKAILTGALDEVRYEEDPVFGLAIPKTCPDVPDAVLNPRATWDDAEAYDRKAKQLAGLFHDNFRQFSDVDEAVRQAGPRVSESETML